MKIKQTLIFSLLPLAFCVNVFAESFIRVNQLGFFPDDQKNAVVFSKEDIGSQNYSIIRVSDGQKVWGPNGLGRNRGPYAAFPNNYVIDFSGFRNSGRYKITISDGAQSPEFEISPCVYRRQQDEVMNFFHQQRCGYNPYLGKNCHMFKNGSRKDAKVVGGPLDGKTLDVSGGWHDAGDYIKFMITSSNVTYFLLFSYRENPGKFGDNYDANGRPGTNGIPDILDEAKWGLDWMLRMHPTPDEFFYQVGDEADHNYQRLPYEDIANYKTSPYRPVYSGIGANNCGRAAAAFTVASTIWKDVLKDEKTSALYLKTARELYKLGSDNLRAQPSTPPDFYTESTFVDDMELGAAELYRVTKNKKYLMDAEKYALQAGSSNGWLDWGTISFISHYVLYPYASSFTQEKLKAYMKQDMDYHAQKAASNPFKMCVEYVWGSMALKTGAYIKAVLYRKLFNDRSYINDVETGSRDYLLGNNQWGVCYIVGMGTRSPQYAHGQIPILTGKPVYGMAIEGPMRPDEWRDLNIQLRGTSQDLVKFDSDVGLYHDEAPDYATNEMTIWQGALTAAMFSMLSADGECADKKAWVREGPVVKSAKEGPSVKTAASGKSKVIDNCDDGDGQNALGYAWFTFNDASEKGTSTVTPPPEKFKMSKSGAKGGKYCAKITGSVTKDYEYGFAGLGCMLGRVSADVSKYSGVKFYIKGDSKAYDFILTPDRTKVQTEYNDYKFTVEAKPEWTLVTVPFSSMTQESGWGKISDIKDSLANAASLNWQTKGQPLDSFELAVDDVSFY